MPTDVSDRVRETARYRDTDESAGIQHAIESDVETLRGDVVIANVLSARNAYYYQICSGKEER